MFNTIKMGKNTMLS